jgi:hypothetical protein
MNKLTTLRLASGPALFRAQRQVLVRPALAVMNAVAPNVPSNRGLACTWMRDPETGRLECTWSSLSQSDRSSARRHGRRALGLLPQPMKRAA